MTRPAMEAAAFPAWRAGQKLTDSPCQPWRNSNMPLVGVDTYGLYHLNGGCSPSLGVSLPESINPNGRGNTTKLDMPLLRKLHFFSKLHEQRSDSH